MSEANLIARLHTFLEPHHEVLEGYLFGSHARGQEAAHSDVDVAVFLDDALLPPTSFGYASDLTTDLMQALRKNEVDVVILNHAPPMLYYQVLRDGVRILSRDLAATTRREGVALSRYCDFAIQLAKIDRAFSRRVRSGAFGT